MRDAYEAMQLMEHVDLHDILIVFSQDGISLVGQTLCLALRNLRYTDYKDFSVSEGLGSDLRYSHWYSASQAASTASEGGP